MKSFLPFLFTLGFINQLSAQITSAVIRANFGVEADLDANYYNGLVQAGNDDWFSSSSANGPGVGVIDTTGAAAMTARYAIDPAFRKLPFFRTMNVPSYSVVNHRLLIDAVFIRDYHGDDSTIFAAGASKNGMSPQYWSCPVSQSVPDKNEILDMMVHVRRAGPNTTDSLWMFGGLSIENTSGDRYFDFEMYQTDIYYDRATLQFYGYGPDAGHTSWKFDVSGNITTPGDIIFSADYGSSTLSSIEARIWIDKASLLTTPLAFNWTGSFDGASNGSQFGYAGITPKTAGAFYTGTENFGSTWAGPFKLIRGDNSINTNYTAGQFMEFGVNLSKLGLDPVTLLGGNACGMPFRRVLVKSRASTSFTAALKDFVGPFDFFLSPRVKVAASSTALCGLVGTSTVKINNPVSTSTYMWSTANGHISQNNGDTSIVVDKAGTYIVTQKLQSGCSVYASDTIVITSNPQCFILQNLLKTFTGSLVNNSTSLNWSVTTNVGIKSFQVERSYDGVNFTPLSDGIVYANTKGITNYKSTDYIDYLNNFFVYCRLKLIGINGEEAYSKVVKISLKENDKGMVIIIPNPVKDIIRLNVFSPAEATLELSIFDFAGRMMKTLNTNVQKGNTELTIDNLKNWPRGVYSLKTLLGDNLFVNKMVLIK